MRGIRRNEERERESQVSRERTNAKDRKSDGRNGEKTESRDTAFCGRDQAYNGDPVAEMAGTGCAARS